MSDIPLRKLRRHKNRGDYTPLDDPGDSESRIALHSPNPDMTRVTTIGSNANARRNRDFRSGLRGRYVDEPEEEAQLLGNAEGFDGADEDSDEPATSPHQVEPMARKTSREQYHSILQHLSPSFATELFAERLQSRYPPNTVRNQKYNVFTFLPVVFYEQFKFFFNLYFLLVALSQFIPALKIGFIVTYVAPLAFVLCVTIGKEAYDDYKRHLRDKEANSQRYLILQRADASSTEEGYPNTRSVPSSSLRVGDLVHLEKNQRVPADLVLLRTSDASGTCFIRTDQLDGETDWKLRVAVPETQKLAEKDLPSLDAEIYADPPIKDIHTFVGTFTLNKPPQTTAADSGLPMQHLPPSISPLTAENVLWSNTVLAAGSAVGFVVYTGSETGAVMNTSHPETKVGLLDLEINRLAKILCAVTFALSIVLVALNGFRGQWYIYVFRFLIIIPISRVNWALWL
ncbi:hypothetical protein D9611_010005 [Ephemerocybe angulata]|uniref:P-type ATPase N-terminal domain-containing protein n=1 Tax=Ephemerocybe angulata TaxID=980116 RepID=A0A8H5FFM5_9AGAR|nr:hypothetical protein D9611_010005 [Tulosesus angulatus]